MTSRDGFTSLIITSGENIGIVRATNVKSRYVTAAAGVILVLIALFAPISRLAASLPGPVVGGTAVIVFAIIGVIGIDMLRRVDLRDHGRMFTLASALPAVMLGGALSRITHSRIGGAGLRTAVLAFAMASGLFLIAA